MNFAYPYHVFSFILNNFETLNLEITENVYIEYAYKFINDSNLSKIKKIYLLIMPILESKNCDLLKSLNNIVLRILNNNIVLIVNNCSICLKDYVFLKYKNYNKIKDILLIKTKMESLIFLNKNFYAKEIIQLKILINLFKKD